jgi:hypothetical protein
VTKDDIMDMAKEAGMPSMLIESSTPILYPTPESLERFAKAIAAAEREACARLLDDAKASIWEYFSEEVKTTAVNVCTNLAAAIRARGTP